MDEYYKLAAAYFKEFEPRSAFPGLKTYHWYLWLLTLSAFCFFSYQVFVENLPTGHKPYWSFFITEVLFLFMCGAIGLYRFKHTVKATSQDSDDRLIDRLGIAKRTRLEKLFDRPSWQFTEVVEGIINLRKLEKAFRTPFDQGLVEFLSKFYDSKTQAKLLTLIASLLTLFVGLLTKSDGFSLTEILSDKGKRDLVVAVSKLVLVILIGSIATYFFFRQLLAVLPQTISSVFPAIRSDQANLEYLIRDLIRFKTMPPQVIPAVVTKEEQPPESTHSAQQLNEPGFGLLATTICLAIFAGWVSRTPNSSDNATSRNESSGLR